MGRGVASPAGHRVWIATAAWLAVVVGAQAADPLDQAIRNNDSTTLERAVRDGQVGNLAAADGKTVLMAAAADDNLALLDLLLARGEDAAARNQRGGNALMYAAANGANAATRRLLRAGVAVDERAGNGWTALILAAAKGHADTVGLLLDARADPNVPDVFGYTAIMRAAENRHRAVVALLAASPATDLARVNARGTDVLDIARLAGHCDIVQLLTPTDGDATPCPPR